MRELSDRIRASQPQERPGSGLAPGLEEAFMVTGANLVARQSETLIARIRSGEGAAEEELVALYRRPIFAIAAARTGDREAARDLTQEVLMAVLQAVRDGQVRESDKLGAVIQGTTRNLIHN